MPLLTGLTSTNTQVPLEVTAGGRIIAQGLQGPTGPAGPAGPAGLSGGLSSAALFWSRQAWSSRFATVETWNSVIWHPAAFLYVAVASTGTNRVITSPDGITWTARAHAVSSTSIYRAQAYSPSLGRLVAVGDAGSVMYSDNATAWTAGTTISAENYLSVAWSPTLSLFAAPASTGSGSMMTSPDGITWTSRTLPTLINPQFRCICWSDTLGIFLALTYTDGQGVTSSDGITWTAVTLSSAAGWTSVVWAEDLGLFVAVADSGATARCVTSPDGTTWTDRTVPASAWASLVWAREAGLLTAVGPNGSDIVSKDGINWQTLSTPANTGGWRAVAWSYWRFQHVAVTSVNLVVRTQL